MRRKGYSDQTVGVASSATLPSKTDPCPFPFDRPCPHCQAQKILPSKIQLSFHLPAGAPEGFEIVFDGDADESPEWEAGDVIVRTRSRRAESNGAWGRKGQSLVWRKTIGIEDVRFLLSAALPVVLTDLPLRLLQALLGLNASVTHLDGHIVDLSRSGVTQPGHVHQIVGEGMPSYGDSPAGDLFVHYDVVLPSSMTHALRHGAFSAWRYPFPPSCRN